MKPKIAFYWCASCGGCEEAVLDLAEDLLEVASAVDIVFWPVALDFKKRHVEAMEDGGIAASFINGAVRTTEQEEMARLLRRKSRNMIAFGACAQMGGIPALANLTTRQAILETVFGDKVGQAFSPVGNGWPALPALFDTVRTLDQAIEVDYYIPGCPPTPRLLKEAVAALLEERLPAKGAVLAPDRALCDECPRRETKEDKQALAAFKRPHQTAIDERTCLRVQGLLCLGSSTRSGCGARCPRGNMPCTGCFGPTSRVRDFGGKALSAMASLAASNDEREIEAILAGIPDPVGTFYRYSLAASLLRRKRKAENGS